MKELNFSWKYAAKILFRHNLLANQITGMIIFVSWACAWLVLKAMGSTIKSSGLLEHKVALIVVILLLHFTMVNLYAIWRIFTKPFKRFRLAVIALEKEENK